MSSLGVGIACTTSVGPRFTLATEFDCLAGALVRRLISPRGSLPWAPNDGTDLRDFLNHASTPAGKFALERAAQDECEKDERVTSCSASSVFSNGTATLTLGIVTASGPFQLVLLVEALTIQILGAN